MSKTCKASQHGHTGHQICHTGQPTRVALTRTQMGLLSRKGPHCPYHPQDHFPGTRCSFCAGISIALYLHIIGLHHRSLCKCYPEVAIPCLKICLFEIGKGRAGLTMAILTMEQSLHMYISDMHNSHYLYIVSMQHSMHAYGMDMKCV